MNYFVKDMFQAILFNLVFCSVVCLFLSLPSLTSRDSWASLGAAVYIISGAIFFLVSSTLIPIFLGIFREHDARVLWSILLAYPVAIAAIFGYLSISKALQPVNNVNAEYHRLTLNDLNSRKYRNAYHLDIAHLKVDASDLERINQRMPKLWRLVLSADGLSREDYASLINFKNLHTLRLENIGENWNAVEGLNHVEQLRHLDLDEVRLEDISPLGSLHKLPQLAIGKNRQRITNLDAISGMSGLTSLNAWYNEIEDISGLQNLTKLESLLLQNNKISDISALANLTNLTCLDLSWNEIVDVSPLVELPNFTQFGNYSADIPCGLDLSYNRIKDISPLVTIFKDTEVDSFHMYANEIKDISALKNMPQLKTLSLSRNQIESISVLNTLKKLETVHLSKNNITEVELSNLPNLKQISLSDNRLKKVILTDLPKLEEVNLQNNPSLEDVIVEGVPDSVRILRN